MARTEEQKAQWLARRWKQQLSSTVFESIFDYILNTDVDTDPRARHTSLVDKLYELQPLTAVCRAWRRATLPLFYYSAVCSIKETPHYGQDSHTKDSRRRCPRHIRRTNIGLVIAGGHVGLVKRLVIDLVGDVAPDLPVTLLANEQFDCQDWSGIRSLRLSHWHGYIYSKPVYSSESQVRLNAYLLRTLPKLKSVQYNSFDDKNYYTEFPLDGLLGTLLSQLSAVHIWSGLVPDLGCSAFLTNLTSLTLRCPLLEDAANLPRVFAETLVTLHMGFTSAETIWDRFCPTDGTHRIEFRRLKSLVLEYYQIGDKKHHYLSGSRVPSLYDECSDDFAERADGSMANNANVRPLSKLQPIFYQLQCLSIYRYPHSIDRVLRHFPIDQIPHISIRDIAQGWSELQAASIAEIASLRVNIARKLEAKGEERKYQAWINRLFSVSSHMTKLQLQAPPTKIPIALPDVIGLTSLTALSFSMKMDLGTIPNLLSRLPHLRRLAMHIHPQSSWSLRNGGILDDGDYELLVGLPPLSHSLQHLIAYTGLGTDADHRLTGPESLSEDEGREPAAVEKELAWLIARIPSLMVFKTEEWTVDAVDTCIKEMTANEGAAPYINHLKRLKMSVWKY
ncbi:hypothetical protein GGI12_001816 [Dipsacomyces acuminosporus]|nr:hypothetical protein GGI12_001816 [Dipsacomyces acuminosporus]